MRHKSVQAVEQRFDIALIVSLRKISVERSLTYDTTYEQTLDLFSLDEEC